MTADNSVFSYSNANDMRVTQDLTLSGRLSLMRTVQLMKKMSDASKNIFRVYHIRIIAYKKNGSHDMKQTDSSIIIVRNVCVLTSASMFVYLFVTRS